MDWNNNGHRDDFDRMMDYNTFFSKPNNTQNTNIGGCLSTIIVAVVIILIMGFIGSACSACNKKSTYTSSYKYHYTPHNYSSSTYSKPSYSSNSTSYSSNSATSSYSSKNKYSSSYKSKYHYSSNDDTDEYNAKDYVDADDFYYDHYDDFYDYEDAEDYYDEHCDD